ncbi:porin family protein [Massilia aerilata]|uniref:Porin family protein n=1 Tax=Massilia aerilata TaxID=453817 RepID=A0ABW0S1M6_9BURK
MKKLRSSLLAGLCAIGAAQAQAIDAAPAPATAESKPHAYVGLGLGVVSDTIAGGRRANAKIFGGYEFDRNWGVEAGLAGFRTSEFVAVDYRPDGSYDVGQGKMKSARAYLAGKYSVPVSDRFSAFGKFGLSYSQRKISAPVMGWNHTDRDTGLYAGLGAQYKLTGNLDAVVEYERYGKRKVSGPKADVYSIGLKYGF